MHTFTIDTLDDIMPQNVQLFGNRGIAFLNFKPVMESGSQSLTWIKRGAKQAAAYINETNAAGIVCDAETFKLYEKEVADKLFIVTDNPRSVFFTIVQHVTMQNERQQAFIHPTAIIHPECKMGENVSIGAYCIIGACSIGDGTKIYDHVKIDEGVTIGSHCVIREFCTIGGAGFGIEKDEQGNNFHVPHVGSVVLKDHVLVMPFSNIDRGTLGDTVVGAHTCIDHYCHISHNTHIGENNVITAASIFAGGSKVGDNCFIGLNTILKEKGIIGSGVMTGIATNVVSDIPDKQTWVGNPAMEIGQFLKIRKFLKNSTQE